MNASVVFWLCSLASAVLVVVLALRDPKRLRTSRASDDAGMPRFARRTCVAMLLLPALALPIVVGWSGFVLWLACVMLAGWCITLLLAIAR